MHAMLRGQKAEGFQIFSYCLIPLHSYRRKLCSPLKTLKILLTIRWACKGETMSLVSKDHVVILRLPKEIVNNSRNSEKDRQRTTVCR